MFLLRCKGEFIAFNLHTRAYMKCYQKDLNAYKSLVTLYLEYTV